LALELSLLKIKQIHTHSIATDIRFSVYAEHEDETKMLRAAQYK